MPELLTLQQRARIKENILQVVAWNKEAYITNIMMDEVFAGDMLSGRLGEMERDIFILSGHTPPSTPEEEAMRFCAANGLVFEAVTHNALPCFRFFPKPPKYASAYTDRGKALDQLRAKLDELRGKWIVEGDPLNGAVNARPGYTWGGWREVDALIREIERS